MIVGLILGFMIISVIGFVIYSINYIIVENDERVLQIGLMEGEYFQHYYNEDGTLDYSCISKVELTAEECKVAPRSFSRGLD